MLRAIRDLRGQAVIEFIVVVICLVAFAFVFADMMRICYNWACIQYAVNKGGRYGKTVAESVRVNSTHAEVIRIAGALGVQLADEDVVVTLSPEFNIQARKVLHVNPLTGILSLATGNHGGDYKIVISEVIRNELFGDLF